MAMPAVATCYLVSIIDQYISGHIFKDRAKKSIIDVLNNNLFDYLITKFDVVNTDITLNYIGVKNFMNQHQSELECRFYKITVQHLNMKILYTPPSLYNNNWDKINYDGENDDINDDDEEEEVDDEYGIDDNDTTDDNHQADNFVNQVINKDFTISMSPPPANIQYPTQEQLLKVIDYNWAPHIVAPTSSGIPRIIVEPPPTLPPATPSAWSNAHIQKAILSKKLYYMITGRSLHSKLEVDTSVAKECNYYEHVMDSYIHNIYDDPLVVKAFTTNSTGVKTCAHDDMPD